MRAAPAPGLPKTPPSLPAGVYREFERIVENLRWLRNSMADINAAVQNAAATTSAGFSNNPASSQSDVPDDEDSDDIFILVGQIAALTTKASENVADLSAVIAQHNATMSMVAGFDQRISNLESMLSSKL